MLQYIQIQVVHTYVCCVYVCLTFTDQLECTDPKRNDFRTTHNRRAHLSTPHPPSFDLLQAYSWSLPTVSRTTALRNCSGYIKYVAMFPQRLTDSLTLMHIRPDTGACACAHFAKTGGAQRTTNEQPSGTETKTTSPPRL